MRARASQLLEGGLDLVSIGAPLGHSDLGVTARYAQASARAAARAPALPSAWLKVQPRSCQRRGRWRACMMATTTMRSRSAR